MTKYHELLAGGPKGCDFSGLEQGTLGMPLEQLGHELTAVEVPLERDRKRRVFLELEWETGREEGSWEGKAVGLSLSVASFMERLDSISTMLQG